jgi:hypothetical protein
MQELLLDSNFCTAHCLASKAADLACLIGYNTIAFSMNSEVTAGVGACAGTLGLADLTNDNLANTDFLTTEELNAEALALTVAGIFASTACFYV